MARAPKILALQFKYFGDAVLLTPALRALQAHFPNGELHLLLPEEIAPVFQHLPWLDRVWPMPRQRGRARPGQSWPVIRALRRERFDRPAPPAAPPPGAPLSLLSGARQRLGALVPGGFLGRRFCYHQQAPFAPHTQHESRRLWHILSAWDVAAPFSWEPEIRTDPALAARAAELFPVPAILCHLASSQLKKEWPAAHWVELYKLAGTAGLKLIFSTGIGTREESLLDHFRQLAPGAQILQPIPELALYLAVLKRAKAFVSGDTGPLHFAAGVGVPTLALFGPSSPVNWAPIGPAHRFLAGNSCTCGDVGVCQNSSPCIAAIQPKQVLASLLDISSMPA